MPKHTCTPVPAGIYKRKHGAEWAIFLSFHSWVTSRDVEEARINDFPSNVFRFIVTSNLPPHFCMFFVTAAAFIFILNNRNRLQRRAIIQAAHTRERGRVQQVLPRLTSYICGKTRVLLCLPVSVQRVTRGEEMPNTQGEVKRCCFHPSSIA